MTLLALYAGCAAAAGLIALARPPRAPRSWWLLALAAAPQLLAIAGLRHSALALLSLALALAWCWRNRGLPGAALLAAGVGLNLALMAAHGGAMPVSTAALAQIGLEVAHGAAIPGSKDVAVAGSPLWMLGDWIVLRAPGATFVASPGDIIALLGLLRWLTAGGQGRQGRTDVYARPHPDATGAPPAAAG